MSATHLVIGVDVSKQTLDAHARPANQSRRFPNHSAGIAELVAWVKTFTPTRLVFESTGHYQKAAVGALLAEVVRLVVDDVPLPTMREHEIDEPFEISRQFAKRQLADALGVVRHPRRTVGRQEIGQPLRREWGAARAARRRRPQGEL